ncbi:hypothetical protein E2C01_084531 [Portunus trituberculatus]|uniref:Uncharacterized protein n=1 Tax=Portunus trituberculatus TaxID=210409 RepID=A0A5B7J7T1_PORTR|nr:hypothetical protein [Portunus trituberculatus]
MVAVKAEEPTMMGGSALSTGRETWEAGMMTCKMHYRNKKVCGKEAVVME